MGEITIREFPLYFIPLEHDLLSLELESTFEELYLVCTLGLGVRVPVHLSYQQMLDQSVKITPPSSTRLGRS